MRVRASGALANESFGNEATRCLPFEKMYRAMATAWVEPPVRKPFAGAGLTVHVAGGHPTSAGRCASAVPKLPAVASFYEKEGTVRFCWEEDPRAETEGVVVAVDVTRHAHRAGLETPTFVSRGVWVRFIGAGSGQEQRLLDTLTLAARKMSTPDKASDDGTAALFGMQIGGGATVDVVSIVDTERDGVTFMLWREFACRPAGRMLRVRIVAKDDIRPQV